MIRAEIIPTVNSPFTIPQYFEAGATLTGFICFPKVRNSYWIVFPFYLLFITAADVSGTFMATKVNTIFFNDIVIPAEFFFFYWLFHESFKKTRYRLLPVICAASYVVAWLFDVIILKSHGSAFYFVSYTVGNLLLLILILLFFTRLVTSDAILSFRQNKLFWVSLGLLMFYLGSFPYYGLYNIISKKYYNLNIIYSEVVEVLNCLMYLMFTFSFAWGKRNIQSL